MLYGKLNMLIMESNTALTVVTTLRPWIILSLETITGL